MHAKTGNTFFLQLFTFFFFPKEEETDNEENFIDLNVLKAQTYRLVSNVGYTQDQQANSTLVLLEIKTSRNHVYHCFVCHVKSSSQKILFLYIKCYNCNKYKTPEGQVGQPPVYTMKNQHSATHIS